MSTVTHKRALILGAGLVLAATLSCLATFAGPSAVAQTSDDPTLLRLYRCEDGSLINMKWGRHMPQAGRLGDITIRSPKGVSQAAIQVFDPQGTDAIDWQFQAQKGAFYCHHMSVSADKRSVTWSECRNFVEQTCYAERPGGDNQP